MIRFRRLAEAVFFILTLGFDALVFVLILVTCAKTVSHAVEEGLFSPPFLISTLCVMAAFVAVIVCAFLNFWSTWRQARDRNPAPALKITACVLAGLVSAYFLLLQISVLTILWIMAYQALNMVQDRLYRRRHSFSGAEIEQQGRNN